jgi:hypothetical protein
MVVNFPRSCTNIFTFREKTSGAEKRAQKISAHENFAMGLLFARPDRETKRAGATQRP